LLFWLEKRSDSAFWQTKTPAKPGFFTTIAEDSGFTLEGEQGA
jgi:hypothetical protein